MRQAAISLCLLLSIVTLWSLTHKYGGLQGDAELYAFQALAKTHPALAGDIYLGNESQAQYTVFSPLYSGAIALLGLDRAAVTLTVLFKAWFLLAAWKLARALSSRKIAIISIALLVTAASGYGASGVFQYLEDSVTARSLAEALVITAFALHFHGFRLVAVFAAIVGFAIHPVMALPGLLLLLCLWLPNRICAIGAAAGTAILFGVSVVEQYSHLRAFAVMDADWLEIVRERSQFLFPRLWSFDDWMLNLRPFLSLALSAIALRNTKVSRLCFASALVGVTGLIVSFAASLSEPIALLVQGQAWRWIWVTIFVGVLLSVPAGIQIWRQHKAGPMCAIAAIAAWILPASAGVLLLSLALFFWLSRDHILVSRCRAAGWTAAALVITLVVWKSGQPYLSAASSLHEQSRDLLPVSLFGFGLVVLLVRWLPGARPIAVLSTFLVLLTSSAIAAPRALKVPSTTATYAEFADWRSSIPDGDAVLVLPAGNSAKFAWFTLQRPSYLTVNQSAGVVFSRVTALEVRRRAQVMLPVSEPDWQILSNIKRVRKNKAWGKPLFSTRPLSADGLVALCSDEQLNFIVAAENVGFDPARHSHEGTYRDWNLYDCRHVRTLSNSP